MFGAERPQPAEAAERRRDGRRTDPSLPWWRRNKTGREKDPDGGIGSQDLTELLAAGLRSQGGFEQAAVTIPPAASPSEAAHRGHRPVRARGRQGGEAGRTRRIRDDSDQDPLDDGVLPGLSGIGVGRSALGARARRTACLRSTRSPPARRTRRAPPPTTTSSRAITSVLRSVPGRRTGHRLLARTDGHAVRDRGRPRRQGRADHGAARTTSPTRWPPTRCASSPRSPARARSASRSPTSTARSSRSATCCARRPRSSRPTP